MGKVLSFIALNIWLVITLILIISIVGIFVVCDAEQGWMRIGKDLVKNLSN